MTSHHVKYIPSEDTLWEFSAPGYCDFSIPYIPLPDDGYFDPCLLENADGFDRYPAPPTPQGPIAVIPSTPGTCTELIIEPPRSIPRSAARRIATPKTTITTMQVVSEGNISLISTHVNAPLPPPHNTLSLLQEDDYSDLKSPMRPIKGAWLQHVMAIAQNSASSSVVESSTLTSCETENIVLSSISTPVESNESYPTSEPKKNEEELSNTSSTLSPNVLSNGGIPRSPRIQVSGILSAASSTHTIIQEEVSELNVIDKETIIDDKPSSKPSSTSPLSVQFTFSPQLVKAVEEDAQVFFQTTSETIKPLSSLDEIDLKFTISSNQTTPVSVIVPENVSISENESTATLVTSSISVPVQSTSLMQMTKTRVISSGHTSAVQHQQQQQKKAPVPITSKSSGVIPPPQPPSSLSILSSTSHIKKSALAATNSTASTSASSALAAFKQRTAALAAKVFASANVANTTTQEMRPPPSGVAQFIASTSPSKKTIKSTMQSTNVEAAHLLVPSVLPSTTTGHTSGARRVPKAEPTSMISTLSSALVPASISVAAPLPGSGFVPVQQATTSFVPTALLLAKYETGVRDLVIPTITAAGSKPSTSSTVNKKTDVQPFTFATAGRANRRKSADASLAPAALTAIAASALDGFSHHHYHKQQSSDSQQRTMSALASKRTVARVPSTLQDVSTNPTETSTFVPLEPVNVAAINPTIAASQTIAPALLMPHKLGEIPDAVKRAARIAQEERTAAETINTHSTATVTISEASITTAGGGAQGRLERFHGLLNKMGRTLASASTVPVVAVSVPTSKENVLVSKPRSLLPLPTVAKSPLLHTKRRTLERAQQQN